jgi:hypothetical protein
MLQGFCVNTHTIEYLQGKTLVLDAQHQALTPIQTI